MKRGAAKDIRGDKVMLSPSWDEKRCTNPFLLDKGYVFIMLDSKRRSESASESFYTFNPCWVVETALGSSVLEELRHGF